MGRNTSHKNVSWCMKSQISTFTFFFLFLPTFILILEDFSLKKYFPIFPIWFITKWIFLLCIKYQMHRKSHFHHPKWAMQIHNERQAWDELFSELQITLKRNHLKSSHKNANPFEQRNIRCRRRYPLSVSPSKISISPFSNVWTRTSSSGCVVALLSLRSDTS